VRTTSSLNLAMQEAILLCASRIISDFIGATQAILRRTHNRI
jgi:hypothetical protein